MKTGLFFLVLGYVLSQFYRAFLAVLAPHLHADIGVGADDLALSSGLWFLAFAAMQIPVGRALDALGPRRTTAWMLALGGGGGALLFACARGPLTLHAAMILIGAGCAPVLMASYYIFARLYPPALFATFAGVMLGTGSLGNIAGAWPLAWAAGHFGWRATMLALAVLTLLTALALARFIQDPPRAERGAGGDGSLFDLLKMPGLWFLLPILLVNYAPAAGLRGLWVGPYYTEVFGTDSMGVGRVTLLMALAMVAGNFLYGPLDRVFGTRKGVVLMGNLAGTACLFALWRMPAGHALRSALLLSGVGLLGASYPMIMAHGRSLFPPHLLGRGVTLLNLFSVGGVGLLQLASGRVHAAAAATATTPEAPYRALFLFFGLSLLAGSLLYAFSRDRTD